MLLPLVWVIPIIFMSISIVQWIITMVSYSVIMRLHMYDVLDRLKEKINLKRSNKIIITMGSIAILILGTAQTAQFYLVSGAYFWLVLLSLGLYLFIFLVPWLNLILPYQKKFKLKSMLLFNMSTGTLLLWIIALINSPSIIYLDEGGVNSRPANVPLKLVAIGLLIIYYVLSLVLMISANDIYITNKKKLVVKSVVKPIEKLVSSIFSPIYSFLYRVAKDKRIIGVKNWIKSRLNHKNIAVLVSIIPTIFILIVLSIEKVAKYDNIPFQNTILLSVTVVTIFGGLISVLFLGNHKKWIKRTSLFFYTSILIINLLITFISTRFGFTFLFDIISEGLNSLELYLIAIKQIGILLLNILAWIVPYLLLYRSRKN
jgi:hypothetical protein